MKEIEDMTAEELGSEFFTLDHHFQRCREGGHGISTSESSRFSLIAYYLTAKGKGDIYSEYHDCDAAMYAAYAAYNAKRIAAIILGRSQLAKAQ